MRKTSIATGSPRRIPGWVRVSVMLATFMTALDSLGGQRRPAAHRRQPFGFNRRIDLGSDQLSGSNAIMLPAAGWIARRIGRKRLLMISILVFTAASLLCGMAPNMPMLIVARILQGIGGGGMQPLAQAILLESFPPRNCRARPWPSTASALWSLRSSARPWADGSPTVFPGAGSSTSTCPVGLLALVHGQPVHRRSSLPAPGLSRGHRLPGLWPDGHLDWAPCSCCWTRGRRRTGSKPIGFAAWP
jgi:MFS family permease